MSCVSCEDLCYSRCCGCASSSQSCCEVVSVRKEVSASPGCEHGHEHQVTIIRRRAPGEQRDAQREQPAPALAAPPCAPSSVASAPPALAKPATAPVAHFNGKPLSCSAGLRPPQPAVQPRAGAGAGPAVVVIDRYLSHGDAAAQAKPFAAPTYVKPVTYRCPDALQPAAATAPRRPLTEDGQPSRFGSLSLVASRSSLCTSPLDSAGQRTLDFSPHADTARIDSAKLRDCAHMPIGSESTLGSFAGSRGGRAAPPRRSDERFAAVPEFTPGMVAKKPVVRNYAYLNELRSCQ